MTIIDKRQREKKEEWFVFAFWCLVFDTVFFQLFLSFSLAFNARARIIYEWIRRQSHVSDSLSKSYDTNMGCSFWFMCRKWLMPRIWWCLSIFATKLLWKKGINLSFKPKLFSNQNFFSRTKSYWYVDIWALIHSFECAKN